MRCVNAARRGIGLAILVASLLVCGRTAQGISFSVSPAEYLTSIATPPKDIPRFRVTAWSCIFSAIVPMAVIDAMTTSG